MKLIITPDDSGTRQEQYTFLVYNFCTGLLEYKQDKCQELDCINLSGQGRATFRPFGITYDETYIYVASHNKLAAFNKLNYKFEKLIDIPLYVNTHQILKDNNTFYTCNTSVDSIGIYTNESKKHLDVTSYNIVDSIEPAKNAYEKDTVHVNSLYEYNGNIYFCLHNGGKKSSTFGYFNKDTLEVKIIAEAGLSSHGLAIINNKLYSLSSGTGEIIEIDLETNILGYYQLADPKLIFLRGLDTYNESLIVGCSNNHDAEMKQENCNIYLFNPKFRMASYLMNINEAFTISDLKLVI
jgi:hypothetical protein